MYKEGVFSMNLRLEINEKKTTMKLVIVLLGLAFGLTAIGSAKMQKELVELRNKEPRKAGFK
jgi:hypothetical protein